MLRSTYGERVRTMLEYVEETQECRSRFLLRYFGQEKSADCGKCDLCRARAARPKDLEQQLKAWILERDGMYTLADIRSAFGTADENYLPVLRALIDRKEVPPYA